jgi:hypothetical protein
MFRHLAECQEGEDGGVHARFYQNSKLIDKPGEILLLTTAYEWKQGVGFLNLEKELEPMTELELGLEERLRILEHPDEGMSHVVGGASSGARRDIQRAQKNPEMRIMIGDWVVIRTENEEDDLGEKCPFQVAVVTQIKTNAEDFLTSIWVHECGGQRSVDGPCGVKQTYKLRYKGIDPQDHKEKDVFHASRTRKKNWQKQVLARIDPLTIIEWGKFGEIMTTTHCLKRRTMAVISFNPRVNWTMPEKVEKKDDNLEVHAIGGVRDLIPNDQRMPAAVFEKEGAIKGTGKKAAAKSKKAVTQKADVKKKAAVGKKPAKKAVTAKK